MQWEPHPSDRLAGALVCRTEDGEWQVRKSASEDIWELHYGRLRDFGGGVRLPLSMEAGRYSSRAQAILVAEVLEAKPSFSDSQSLLTGAGFEPYADTGMWRQWVGEAHFIVKLDEDWVSLTCDHGNDYQFVGTLGWRGVSYPVSADDVPAAALGAMMELFRIRQSRPEKQAHASMTDEELDHWRNSAAPVPNPSGSSAMPVVRPRG